MKTIKTILSVISCVLFVVYGAIVVSLPTVDAAKPLPPVRQAFVPATMEAVFFSELGHGFVILPIPMQQVSVVLEPNASASVYAVLIDGTHMDLFGSATRESWSLGTGTPNIVEVHVTDGTRPLKFEASNF